MSSAESLTTRQEEEEIINEETVKSGSGSNPHAIAPALERPIYIPFGVPNVDSPEDDEIPFNAVSYIERAHAKAVGDGVPLHVLMSGVNRVIVNNGIPGTRDVIEKTSTDRSANEYYEKIRLLEDRRMAFARAVGDVLNLTSLASVDSILLRMASDEKYRDTFINGVSSLDRHRGDTILFDQLKIGLEDAFTAALPRRKRPKGPIWNGGAESVDGVDHLYPMSDVSAFASIIKGDQGRVMLPAGGDCYKFFTSDLSINEALRHVTFGVSGLLGIDDATVRSSLSTHRSLNGWGFRTHKVNGSPVPVDPYYGTNGDGVLRVPLTGLTREWIPHNMCYYDGNGGYRMNGPAVEVIRKMNPTVKRYMATILDGTDEEKDKFGRRASYRGSRRLSSEQWTALEQWAQTDDAESESAMPMPEKFNIADYAGIVGVLASDIRKRMKDLLSGQ